MSWYFLVGISCPPLVTGCAVYRRGRNFLCRSSWVGSALSLGSQQLSYSYSYSPHRLVGARHKVFDYKENVVGVSIIPLVSFHHVCRSHYSSRGFLPTPHFSFPAESGLIFLVFQKSRSIWTSVSPFHYPTDSTTCISLPHFPRADCSHAGLMSCLVLVHDSQTC